MLKELCVTNQEYLLNGKSPICPSKISVSIPTTIRLILLGGGGGEVNQIEGEESYNSSGDGRLASGANGSILA